MKKPSLRVQRRNLSQKTRDTVIASATKQSIPNEINLNIIYIQNFEFLSFFV